MGLPNGVGKIQALAPGESPVISVPTPPSPPAFVNTQYKAAWYVYPGAIPPIASSSVVNDAAMVALLAGAQSQPTQYYAPPVAAPTGMSTTAMVVVGLLGIVVLGGVVYLALEGSAQ